MENGTKVKTNQAYFDSLHRIIHGIVENNVDPTNPSVTVIRVTDQEGNVILEHNGNLLVVMIRDLEVVKD